MRFLASIAMAWLLLVGAPPASAGSEERSIETEGKASDSGAERIRVGARPHWTPASLGRRAGVGLGWMLPQRWYDADGALLTERSLLNPGCDLERPGFYLALRF